MTMNSINIATHFQSIVVVANSIGVIVTSIVGVCSKTITNIARNILRLVEPSSLRSWEMNKLEGNNYPVLSVAYNSSTDTISDSQDKIVPVDVAKIFEEQSQTQKELSEINCSIVKTMSIPAYSPSFVTGGDDGIFVWQKLDDTEEIWEITRRISKTRFLLTAKGASYEKTFISPINEKLLEERKASNQSSTGLKFHEEIRKRSQAQRSANYYFQRFFRVDGIFIQQGIQVVYFLDKQSQLSLALVNQNCYRFFLQLKNIT